MKLIKKIEAVLPEIEDLLEHDNWWFTEEEALDYYFEDGGGKEDSYSWIEEQYIAEEILTNLAYTILKAIFEEGDF